MDEISNNVPRSLQPGFAQLGYLSRCHLRHLESAK